jgi:hypothetical protein
MNVGFVFLQAGIGFGFLFLGYVMGRRVREAAQPAPSPQCICGHIYSAHIDGYKCACIMFDKYDIKIGNCACTFYLGPDPLMSGLWSPPAIVPSKKLTQS